MHKENQFRFRTREVTSQKREKKQIGNSEKQDSSAVLPERLIAVSRKEISDLVNEVKSLRQWIHHNLLSSQNKLENEQF